MVSATNSRSLAFIPMTGPQTKLSTTEDTEEAELQVSRIRGEFPATHRYCTNSFVYVFDRSIVASRTLSIDAASSFRTASAPSAVIRPSIENIGIELRT